VLVLGVVVVTGFAVRFATGSDGTSARPATAVTTAPTSAAPAIDPVDARALRPPIEPVESGAASCSGSDGPVLRVLQLNIHFGTARNGAIDLRALADQISAVEPDLVSLNEVDDGTLRSGRVDEARYLATATGLHAVYGPNLPWEGGVFGNAVLSRLPVLASENLRLPVADGLEPRGMLTVRVRVAGRVVSFSSVPLSDGESGRVSRERQALAIGGVVRRASGPTIVAGDLNARPGDLPVRVLRQYLLDAQELGGTGPGNTVPEPEPRSRIDYVLHDNAFAVEPGSTRVLPSPSDHRAVLTRLAIRAARCGD
jgi:endonuclease/exonuclease/phosphatase family metal-dependent hydrolase